MKGNIMQCYVTHKDFTYESLQPINPTDFELGNCKLIKDDKYDWPVKEYQEVSTKEHLRWVLESFNVFPDNLIWVSDIPAKRMIGATNQYAKRIGSIRKFTLSEFEHVLKDLNPNWYVLRVYR